MAKLTLSVDEEVVARAKAFAAQHDTSVSKLVEDYLASVASSCAEGDGTPVLRDLRGSLRGTSDEDLRKEYYAYLEKKYS